MQDRFTVDNVEVIAKLKFDAHGLIPAVIQDVKSNAVLMLAYMNQASLTQTLQEGRACYFSRSRQSMWLKGETSGHYQYVRQIYYDCDADSLLVLVEQAGVACHEGYFTCFHNRIEPNGSVTVEGEAEAIPEAKLGKVLDELYSMILERKQSKPEGSYTTYLFDKGQDKILKKFGEETAESIIASKNNDSTEIVYEVSDLLYHMMVLLAYHELGPAQIAAELIKRRSK
ncbi:MAG: bifunctional phosphoribosyl-AMP cyclohydrolase/phosphoribosyl-ATP diphosphatase HisIE [Peptococcaceae bacterium]|nr:bifunctional phosphoribosyl-AMP cyclohydrolase/phosphoribosyl-ATP diphosphatase HisIE [Peptococcaceae bacterium]